MKLEQKYSTKEDIPTGLVGLYKEKDGEFFLSKIDGFVDKEELDTFRENNIEVTKENETLKQQVTDLDKASKEQIQSIEETKTQLQAMKEQFAGVDLEEVEKLKAKQKELEDKKTMAMPDVEALIQKRIKESNEAAAVIQEETNKKHASEIQSQKDITQTKQDRLYKQKIVDATAIYADKLGVVAGAVNDITNRVFGVFKLDEEDNATGFNADGTIMYDKDGVTKVTIESYMTALKNNTDSKHLFVPSEGGSALGGGKDEGADSKASDFGKTDARQDIVSGLNKAAANQGK